MHTLSNTKTEPITNTATTCGDTTVTDEKLKAALMKTIDSQCKQLQMMEESLQNLRAERDQIAADLYTTRKKLISFLELDLSDKTEA